MKLNTVIENQDEQLSLLRKIGTSACEQLEEFSVERLNSVEELEEFCRNLEEKFYRKKVVRAISIMSIRNSQAKQLAKAVNIIYIL